jgi:hypothetical protein
MPRLFKGSVFQRELQVFARARGGFRRAAAADIAAHMQRLPKREVFQIQVRRKAFLHRTSREREEGQKKSLRHQLVAIFFSVLLWAAARARRLFCIVFNRDAHNNTHALFFIYCIMLYFLKQLPIFPRCVTDNGR